VKSEDLISHDLFAMTVSFSCGSVLFPDWADSVLVLVSVSRIDFAMVLVLYVFLSDFR